MQMIEIYTIQNYYGKTSDGTNWFIWGKITVPKNKEYHIHQLNQIIPIIFQLPIKERMQLIDGIVLGDHNNGINQYYPFLRNYGSKAISEFVDLAVFSGYKQK